MLQLKDGITDSDTVSMCTLIEKVIKLPEHVYKTFSELLVKDSGEAKEILDQISKERG